MVGYHRNTEDLVMMNYHRIPFLCYREGEKRWIVFLRTTEANTVTYVRSFYFDVIPLRCIFPEHLMSEKGW